MHQSPEEPPRGSAGAGTPGGDDADHRFALAYSELRRIAAGVLQRGGGGDSLQPTALVHELYLRLAGRDPDRWQDRAHFMAVAAKAMRQIVVDHARRRGAEKRGGGWRRVTLTHVAGTDTKTEVDLIALDEALTQLASLHARQAQIVELRFLGGLTIQDIARLLDMSRETIKRDWRMARAWLMARLGEGR